MTQIHVEDVMKAIRFKSFDYRVLNLLLYQLNGKEVNQLLAFFLLDFKLISVISICIL